MDFVTYILTWLLALPQNTRLAIRRSVVEFERGLAELRMLIIEMSMRSASEWGVQRGTRVAWCYHRMIIRRKSRRDNTCLASLPDTSSSYERFSNSLRGQFRQFSRQS